jgi:HEAT repeat protein
MKCEECQKSLLEHLKGDLSGEAERAVEAHLAECDACAAELAELREAWQALGTIPEEEPGPELSARFYAMLEEAKAEEAEIGKYGARIPPARRQKPGSFEGWLAGWWPGRPAFQLVTALVLLAVGLGIGLGIGGDGGRDIEMAMMQAELGSMRQVLTLALFNQTASADRLAAVNSIRRDEQAAQPALDALVLTLKSDPNVNVRLAAVDALSGFLDRRDIRGEMNMALLSQTSPMVQVSIIEALSGAEDEQLLQTLQSIAQDERVDPLVREHARMRIEKRL